MLALLDPREWAYIALAALVVFGIGSAGGYSYGTHAEHTERVAEVATLKAEHATELAKSERDARERLQAKQAQSDALTARLQETESALKTQSQEDKNAINRVTTGRACLNAATVRVLNGTSKTGTTGIRLPDTGASAPAEDGPAASDTDVATWAEYAREQYETCRGRLSALIDWFVTPTETAQ